MIKQILALFAMFTLIRLGLELLTGPTVSFDLLVGRLYWLPLLPLQQLPDMVFSITNLFPVFPLLFFISLFVGGLLALAELD